MLCSALLAAALAAAVAASPVNLNRRDLVVITDIVTDIVVVMETAGVVSAPSASSAPAQSNWPYYSSGYNVPVPGPAGNRSVASQPSSEARIASSVPVTTTSFSYTAPSTVPSSVADGNFGPSTFVEMVLDHHNAHRANHSAPNMVWDQDLANTAAEIAGSCYYAHNLILNGGGYGQNIAAGAPPSNITAVITDSFYNGEVNYFDDLYGEATPDMTDFENWGHFSQIVWKATGSVGCAVQDCTSQGLGNVGSDVAPFFTVCNYKGEGNVGGTYGVNIGEPLGYPSINYDTFGLL